MADYIPKHASGLPTSPIVTVEHSVSKEKNILLMTGMEAATSVLLPVLTYCTDRSLIREVRREKRGTSQGISAHLLAASSYSYCG